MKIQILGAGYVGVEFSYALSSLGVNVNLVEIMDRPLPSMDRDAGLLVLKVLRKSGVKVYTSSRIEKAVVDESGVKLTITGRRGSAIIESDSVLVAVGRTPNISLEGLEDMGVEFDSKGFIRVDCRMRSNNPRIYAAGDITGSPLLAHKAFIQSIIAAENISGNSVCTSRLIIPEVVYIKPEIARVWDPELASSSTIEEIRIRVESLAMSRIHGEGGFAKLAYEKETGRIVGATLAFEGASEVIGEIAGLIAKKLTIKDALEIVHPHPTLSEAVGEAVHAALGRPLHILGAVRKII
jgi:dihydrolipoamide dehydrogenase